MAGNRYRHSAYWYAYHKGWTYSEAETYAGKYLDVHTYRPRMRVRPDGKLDLSPRKKAYAQMGPDAEVIWAHLKAAGGILGVGDKSDAALIKTELSLSKNAFKRAAGHLLKEGRIRIYDDHIEAVSPQPEDPADNP